MSDDDNGDDGSERNVLQRYRLYIWAGFFTLIGFAVLVSAIVQGVIPNVFKIVLSEPIFFGLGAVTLVGSIGGYVVYDLFIRDKGQDYDFEPRKIEQLSNKEVRELMKYRLYRKNIFVKRVDESGQVYEGDEDDESRLFIMDYTDRNDTRRGLVMNMEQEIDFSIEYIENHEFEKCDRAVREIDSIRDFSEEAGDVSEKIESAIEDMANTKEPTLLGAGNDEVIQKVVTTSSTDSEVDHDATNEQ